MAKQTAAEEKGFKEELIGQLLTLSTSGFGLVAALAWNTAIQQFVADYIEPKIPGSGLISKIIYAILITIFAVLVTYQLSRVVAHLQGQNQSKKTK